MYEFTETVLIEATPAAVWDVMRDIDGWWLASNPEHKSLEHLDDRAVTNTGARLRIREKVAGIPGTAVGAITRVDPGSAVTWEATARYRWLGVTITVSEGVTWRIEPSDRGDSSASAHVWARFPPGVTGRIVEFVFTRMLGGVAKDRAHARTELLYLKGRIEEEHGSRP